MLLGFLGTTVGFLSTSVNELDAVLFTSET